jgi:hypothetical protein
LHARTAAAAYRAITEAGAMCRPPKAGFQLYVSLGTPEAGAAAELEARLSTALGHRVLGGHRFGDDPMEPRVRIDTGALHGSTETERRTALSAADPAALPHVAAGLSALTAALAAIVAERSPTRTAEPAGEGQVGGSADTGSRSGGG